MTVRKHEPYGTALALARLYEQFRRTARASARYTENFGDPAGTDAIAWAEASDWVRFEMERLGLRWAFEDTFQTSSGMFAEYKADAYEEIIANAYKSVEEEIA